MEEIVDWRTAEQSLEGLHASRTTGQGETLKIVACIIIRYVVHIMVGIICAFRSRQS